MNQAQLFDYIDKLIPDAGLVNLGQISDKDLRLIKRAIRIGIVIEILCFDFPVIKNKYIKTLDNLE